MGVARSLRTVQKDFCEEAIFEQKPQAWEELLEERSGLRRQRMPRLQIGPGLTVFGEREGARVTREKWVGYTRRK